MLDTLRLHIATNTAQYTNLFDVETKNVTVDTQSNIISNTGLVGEYTLSGFAGGIASKGGLNNTFTFVDGEVITDVFFGSELSTHNLVAHRVNVGTAISRDVALEMMKDTKTKNSIIVYLGTMKNSRNKTISSISEDLTIKANYTVGVMFKIDMKQVEDIGATNTDVIFINSVVGAKKSNSTVVSFESIVDRFSSGKNYVMDCEFSYDDILSLDAIILDRIKHYDAVVEILQT